MIFCLWTRALINEWVYFINIASIWGALTDPLECNIVLNIAVTWFPQKQHVGATMAGSIATLIGAAIGPFFAFIFIDTNEQNIEVARKSVFTTLIFLAGIYTGIYLTCFLLFKEKPEFPPWYFSFFYAKIVPKQ